MVHTKNISNFHIVETYTVLAIYQVVLCLIDEEHIPNLQVLGSYPQP